MWFRLNKKQLKLKSSVHLTVNEYFTLMTDLTGVNVLSYINATTGSNYETVKDFSNKKNEFSLIKKYISDIKTFDFFLKKGKPQQRFVFRDQLIDLKAQNWDTVGFIEMYSQFADGKKTAIEASVFLLAILVNNVVNPTLRYDQESTYKVYDELFELNHLDVLPSAVFFFKKLTRGLHKRVKY